ncbi:MAG: M20 metallopeptidase family protein [Dehalococcoidia bacterium]
MHKDEILRLADGQRAYIVGARRQIHEHPELSFQEKETAAFVAGELRACGLEPSEGFGGSYGVVAEIEGGRPGPTIALRADMDALPVEEMNDLPFRSKNAGVMHACGHDAHTAVLLGAARALTSVRDQLPGRVRLLFQPAEELPPGGALGMIEAGCLDGVDAIFGLHQSAREDAGVMLFGAGARSASADSFTLTVQGRGGHGAAPHNTIDAIQVAGQVVSGIHQIVGRKVPSAEQAVITIGTIRGGTKENIIAHEVTMTGTVRALSPKVRELLAQEIDTVAKGIAAAWGASHTLDYLWGYPVLVNDAPMTAVARRAAEAVLERDAVRDAGPPIMAAEDFARFLEHIPGCYASLGVGTPGSDQRPPSHSGAFLLDESGLPAGVAWYLSLVMNFESLTV